MPGDRVGMLDVGLLGEFRVSSEGSLLTGLRSPRAQALLGYLALHQGTPQPRQRIAGLFWPDTTDAQARTNLRRELHQLRGALPDPDRFLAADHNTVWWRDDAPSRIDITMFEAAAGQAEAMLDKGDDFVPPAEAAVATYAGDFLPGLYDDWVLAERERLRRRCVQLLDLLIEFRGDADHRAVVGYARRRVELEPLEEIGHRTLIAALADAGDRAAALQAYHRCASMVDRELDAPPSPETTELYERLLARPGPSASAAPSPPLSIAARAAPAPRASRLRSPFVGRAEQRDRLRSVWTAVATGEPDAVRLVVISGEAGIGKTRLAEELLAEARQSGQLAARARCFARERPLPLAPVAEWLRSDACRPTLERLDPAWRAEVARLLPELEADTETTGSADSWQRHRFFEGLVRAVLAVDRPIMLLLDDLQWCDPDTLSWLELCVHLGGGSPILMVATARTEELDDNAELVAALSRLRSAGVVVDVELDPLQHDETAELVTHLVGERFTPSLVTNVHLVTGGFPLFVVEALSHGDHRIADPALGSPRVQAVLEGRLRQLSTAGRDLAGLAAAIGRDFSLELLIEASDMDIDLVVDTLDELWRRRIVREYSATTYDFGHDLLRAVTYDSLSPPQRRGLHRHVAQTLVRMHSEAIDTVAALVADQFDRARMATMAIPYYIRAAQAARRVYAYQESVRLSERALSLMGDVPASRRRDEWELEIRMTSAGPRNALGGWTSPEARRNAERVQELSARTGHRSTQVESLVAMWGMAFVRGALTDALALADRALATSGDDTDLAPWAHMAKAGSLTSAGDPGRALQHFSHATSHRKSGRPELLGFAPEVMAWAWGAHACWLAGRVGEARERAATAITVAEGLAAPFGQAVAASYAAITHQLRGDRDESLMRARETRELCARYEFAYYQHWSEIVEGWLRGGDGGADMITDGIRRLRDHGVGSRLPYYLGLLAETQLDAGRPDAAARTIAEARHEAEQHSDWWWLPELVRLEARLHPGTDGDPHLDRAMAIASEQGSTSLELRAAVDLARRWADRGEPERGQGLVMPLRTACVGRSPELGAIDAWLNEFVTTAIRR